MQALVAFNKNETDLDTVLALFKNGTGVIEKFDNFDKFDGLIMGDQSNVSEATLFTISNNTWTIMDYDALIIPNNGSPAWYERGPGQTQNDWEAHMRLLLGELPADYHAVSIRYN